MLVQNHTVELVLSEFGSGRVNAGTSRLDVVDRLNPTLDGFRSIFPSAKVTLYTDHKWYSGTDINVVLVDPPFDQKHPRYGWRAHDYYQAKGLLASQADIAIAMDSDMLIVSPDFRAILEIARIFGIAVPINPRLILKVDGTVGADSNYSRASDPTLGLVTAYNLSPIAFFTRHPHARLLLERYSERMIEEPGRGTVHLCIASQETGIQPHPLSFQWCASSPRDLDSKHIWREALALHVGHADVHPRWLAEPQRQRWEDRLRHIRRFFSRLRRLS